MSSRRITQAASVALAGAVLLWPLTGRFWSFVGSVAITSALVCLSIVVLTGWTGQLALHQMVFAGWGAYGAFALTRAGIPVIIALPAAALVVVPFAIAVGAVAVRFGRLETAVATLALGLVFERAGFRAIARILAEQSSETNFEIASVPLPRPALGDFRMSDDRWFFWFAALLAVGCVAAVAALQRGEVGRTLRAVRSSALQAELLGIATRRQRLGAFVLSVSIAAVAGAISASLTGSITENAYRLDESLRLLAAAVLGGVGAWPGALIGGALAAFLPQVVGLDALRWASGDNLLLLYGAALVVVFAVAPGGLASLASSLAAALVRRAAPARDTPPDADSSDTDTATAVTSNARDPDRAGRASSNGHRPGALLRAERVSVRFGGVQALDEVSISVHPGQIVALIGPNGAGKTTLFNVLSGVVAPDGGRVYLDGADVTHMPAFRRARLGLGRSRQTVELFGGLTVTEHLMLRGARTGRIAASLTRPAERARHREALQALDDAGLAGYAGSPLSSLPFGALRNLELAAILQTGPRVLLLDEPSAGLDEDETDAFVQRVLGIASGGRVGILFVEHDMQVVGALADAVHVLDFGRTIAAGTPEQVRRDPQVLDAYLGQPLEVAGG